MREWDAYAPTRMPRAATTDSDTSRGRLARFHYARVTRKLRLFDFTIVDAASTFLATGAIECQLSLRAALCQRRAMSTNTTTLALALASRVSPREVCVGAVREFPLALAFSAALWTRMEANRHASQSTILVARHLVPLVILPMERVVLGRRAPAELAAPLVAWSEVLFLRAPLSAGQLGCFSLTERRAGVQSGLVVETTADWDHVRGAFVLHTPDEGARKNWISQGFVADKTVQACAKGRGALEMC